MAIERADIEKAMAPHSSTLAWKIPWMEKPGGYSPWGRKELDMTERACTILFCKMAQLIQVLLKASLSLKAQSMQVILSRNLTKAILRLPTRSYM